MITPNGISNHKSLGADWRTVATAAVAAQDDDYIARLRRQQTQDEATLTMLFAELFGIRLCKTDFLRWANIVVVDLDGTKFRADYIGEEPYVRPVLRMWGRCHECHVSGWSTSIRSAADAGRLSALFVAEHDCNDYRAVQPVLPLPLPRPKASPWRLVSSMLERFWSLLTGLPE